MHKTEAKSKATRRAALLASCDETRRQCNDLPDSERRRLLDKAFAIINGHDAKTPARSR